MDDRGGPRPPRRRIGAAALLMAAALAGGARAQIDALAAPDPDAPVALVADRISFDEAAGTVTARGNVEVYYGARTLTATEIVYDSAADRIRAVGPLTLRGEGGETLFADYADLDAELRDGVIEGARALVADGSARLAAVEGRRIDDRYTSLAKAVYSSCAVCAASPTPLWAIRARRVVHDEAERTVFYEDAVFEILGAPVAYLPFFSHPDPSVERKSGFLTPTFGRSSTFGYNAKLPYFIVIDESRDATVTPFVTSDDGPILELEYRERTARGGFDLSGSGGWLDTGEDGDREVRGHIFGSGRFSVGDLALGEGASAGFELGYASDDGYLRRYGFSRETRLESEAYLERYDPREGFVDASAVYFQSLREEEDQDQIPFVLPEIAFRRDIDAPEAWGDFGVEGSTVWLSRIDGRDRARLTLAADWSRRVVAPFGVALTGFATLRGDAYAFNDDARFDEGALFRLVPQAGVEAFWPLIATNAAGAHVVEPGAQLIVAPTDLNPAEIAADDTDEDSLIVEFDETNIFDRNRSPGYDRVESGARVNLGVRYARTSADDPVEVDASFGRVFRITEDDAFSPGSGLSGDASDYVGALGLRWRDRVEIAHSFRLSEELVVNRNEVIGSVDLGRARVSGSYLLLEADATAGALEDRQETAVAAEIDLDPRWTVGGLVRRDLENNEYIETAATLTFRNECASLELFVGRDFVEREDAPPSTDIGFRVRIFGGGDGGAAPSGVCAAAP